MYIPLSLHSSPRQAVTFMQKSLQFVCLLTQAIEFLYSSQSNYTQHIASCSEYNLTVLFHMGHNAMMIIMPCILSSVEILGLTTYVVYKPPCLDRLCFACRWYVDVRHSHWVSLNSSRSQWGKTLATEQSFCISSLWFFRQSYLISLENNSGYAALLKNIMYVMQMKVM